MGSERWAFVYTLVKLNYQMIKAWSMHSLRGLQLLDYVDDTIPMPPPMVNNAENPVYTKWDTLGNLFATQSSAHAIHTKLQLATLKKGSTTITKYFYKVTTLAATLSAVGHPLPTSEFTIYLLEGLGSDYESLVTSLSTRPNPLSISQFYSYLMNHESRFSLQTNTLLSPTSLTANNTTIPNIHTPNSFSHRGRGHISRGRRGCRGHGFSSGGNSSFPRPPNSRPMCQLCNKPGHTAMTYYFQFDHSYQAPPPISFSANFTAMNPVPSSNSWFPDTAATNHLTSNISNLHLDVASYQGPDQ
ncbi:hypothetical protein F2P56_016828, partial [Juglans regia]